jgi:hypothetical protein
LIVEDSLEDSWCIVGCVCSSSSQHQECRSARFGRLGSLCAFHARPENSGRPMEACMCLIRPHFTQQRPLSALPTHTGLEMRRQYLRSWWETDRRSWYCAIEMHCDLVPGKSHSLPLHHLPAQPQYNPPGTLPPSKHLNPPCTQWSPFAQAASRCWWTLVSLHTGYEQVGEEADGPSASQGHFSVCAISGSCKAHHSPFRAHFYSLTDARPNNDLSRGHRK